MILMPHDNTLMSGCVQGRELTVYALTFLGYLPGLPYSLYFMERSDYWNALLNSLNKF